ncbi:sugar phosphate isomerase/epimerase family protein [Radiobacillus sp. PE A8.2]|uniref:sugar phosphate isomerase/epimerase family protein n=1 Tax=Radiobacillus sp. PE A8.2 TaxID=3380349 RepID=UPI00388FED7B
MGHHFYVEDTWFYNTLGCYEFEERCEMAKELGYEGIFFTIFTELGWKDVPKIKTVKERYGLEVSGVYVMLNDPKDEEEISKFINLIESIEGCSQINLAIVSNGEYENSDAKGDADAIKALRRLLEVAEKHSTIISLYSHIQCWMETVNDTIRLCQKIDHPLLKISFSSYHWTITDGKSLIPTIEKIKPHLSLVNICGIRVTKDDFRGYREAVLDEGEIDPYPIYDAVRSAGFNGPIGVQGFGIAGDIYPKLERSLKLLKSMEKRHIEHPTWGKLRPDPLPLPSGADR